MLGKMLGELDGAVFVGEVNFFWADGVLGGRPCGCGVPVKECPIWARIVGRLGNDPAARSRDIVTMLAETTRTRHGLAMLSPFGRRHRVQRRREIAEHLGALYRAIAAEFQVDVIIDSSKSPMYGEILVQMDGIEIETVHLIRDPRAVADSWRRPKQESIGGSVLPRFGLSHSSVLWLVTNLLAARRRTSAAPYVRVRYEDLMNDTAQQMAMICQALGRATAGLDIADDGRSVSLGTSHSIAGNPNRFETGAIALRRDDGWQSRITALEHRMITVLTLPGLRAFGYPARRVR